MKIVDNSHTIFRGNFNLFCVYLNSNYLTFLQMFVRASQFSFHLHTFCHTQETFFGIVFYSSSTSTANFVFFVVDFLRFSSIRKMFIGPDFSLQNCAKCFFLIFLLRHNNFFCIFLSSKCVRFQFSFLYFYFFVLLHQHTSTEEIKIILSMLFGNDGGASGQFVV